MDNNIELLYRTSNPVSFLTWLESQSTVSQNYNENLQRYQDYVQDWYVFNNKSEREKEDGFAGLYVDLLRDITLSYSTEEEKRFISNCDFTKPEELDIVLPFFIQKLKTIVLYYYYKREQIKKKIKTLSFRGTNMSVSEAIRDLLIEEAQAGTIQVVADTQFKTPNIESIIENLKINVEENYEDTTYFNKKPQVEDLSIDPNLYIDFKESVINAIKRYPLFLEGINSTFSMNVSLSGTEFNLLKKRDFIDYFFSNDADNLKLTLFRDLAVKFMGCDMYYLSTGSTATEFVTGRLFNTSPLSGNVVLNPINKTYPTFAPVPNLTDLYTAYECGGFFVPSKIEALEYNTFNKTYTINRNKLKKDAVVIFPDPAIVGNVADADGDVLLDYPISYEIDVSWNKEKRQNAFKFGDVISKPLIYHFYPYESRSTTIIKDTQGLSTPYDNLTFWGGERDAEWLNSDIWPDLTELERLPIDERLKSLLIDEGVMVKWFVDIFGNEYGLFKPKTETITDKKNTKGTIYIKTTDGKIAEFTNLYSTVFSKLPESVARELKEPLNLFVVNNTILIETENYVVIDIINYNFEEISFISSFYPGFYRKKYNINSNLEKFLGYTYRTDNNALYLCFTTLNPTLSVSNYKSISPIIFKIDIATRKLITVYPGTNNTVEYSLSSSVLDAPEIDIRYIDSGHFSYKEKFGLYNITYIAYNLNNVPFLVNERFYSTPYTETFISTNPIFYKPFLYIYDTNFSPQLIKGETSFVSPYTDWAGSDNIEHYKFHRESNESLLYSNQNTTVINATGSYNITLNWDQNDKYNLVVGCSSFDIINGEQFFLFNYNNKILNEPGREYALFDFNKNGYTFTTFGTITPNNNLSSLEVTVRETFFTDFTATNIPPFTGTFCEGSSPLSSYTIDKFPNHMAVSIIDPAFINKPGTTFLYFDWDQYTQANIYVGCSAFKINYIEDVIVFTSPTVLIFDEEVWYDLFSFNLEGRNFFAKAKIIKNSGRGIMEFYIGEILSLNDINTIASPYSGVFCEEIFDIFKRVEIKKSGTGTGFVRSIPACANCGDNCEFLYPVNSTIILTASGQGESIFSGWLGTGCEGVAGDCALTVTENTTITAVFTKLPRYDVTIFVNVTGGRVTSADSVIDCTGIGECVYSYLGGTPISIEASPPEEGLAFRGFKGGPCDDNSRTCSFFITNNITLTALYQPKQADVIVENIYQKNDFETNYSYFILGRSNSTSDGTALLAATYPLLQDNVNRGMAVCGHASLRSPGTIFCSLCENLPIDYFHVFESNTNIFIYLSAPVYAAEHLFVGYLGQRCEGEISDYCPIIVSNNIAVTGLFIPPLYPLSINHYPVDGNYFNMGNVLVYDRYYGNRSKLSCSSYDSLQKECFGVYISGTKITLAAIPEDGSVVHLLSSNSPLAMFLSGTGTLGTTGIITDFYITSATEIDTFSKALEFKTLTIYKSSFPNNLLNNITITPGPSATSSVTMLNTELVRTFVYPKNTRLQIFPQNSALGKSSYAVGFSGLIYEYEALQGSGLQTDPDLLSFTQGPTLLGVTDGLILQGTTGPLIEGDNLLNISFSNFELKLTENANVSCAFVPYNF